MHKNATVEKIMYLCNNGQLQTNMHKSFGINLLKSILLLCAISVMPIGIHAQTTDSPKVGVVLSGGGAKGAAHIGVLKYMEEIGIPVSYVTGTSMGSIIGGLYALGYSPDEMEEIISDIDWPLYITGKVDRRFLSQRKRKAASELLLNIPYGKYTRQDELDMSAMPLGVMAGDNLLNLFNRLSVGFQDSTSFDSLPIPYACVATDLMTGKPKILHEGEFARALRSSMAIPIFFTPVEWEDRLLADGGVTNNFPVDVCKEMGADIVIGLEVSSELASNPDDLRSVGRQLQQYLSIMTNRGVEEHRNECNIYINPDVSGVNMLSFNKEAIAELIQRGYRAAKAHEEEFLQLKAQLGGGTAPKTFAKKASILKDGDSLIIDKVEFLGMDDDENKFLEKSLSNIYDRRVSIQQIEDLVHVLQGTGLFSSVWFKTVPADDEGHYILKISVSPELPYRMGVGLRYDSEESATLLLHASWNALKLKGWNARFDLGLKYNIWADAHFGWLVMGLGDLGLDGRVHRASFRCNNREQTAMEMMESKVRLGITTVHLPQLELSLGLSQDLNTRMSDDATTTLQDLATGVYLRAHTDTRDEAAYATDGYLLDIEGNLRQPTERLLQPKTPFYTDFALSLEGYLSAGDRLTFIPGFHGRIMWGYNGDELWYNNLAGGNMSGRYLRHQLPFVGMTNTIELGPAAFVYALETRYRIFKKTYLSLHANMLAHSSRQEMADIVTDGYVATHYLGLAGSVGYKSLLGPISLTVGSNTYDRKLHAYLNIGFEF